MIEKITHINSAGTAIQIHFNEGRRVGYTVHRITTQINGGSYGDVLDRSTAPAQEVSRYDMFGNPVPIPVAIRDLRRWQELLKTRTPEDIEAIKKMPIR